MVSYAARPGTFTLVTVPPVQYLMIDGHGDPNTSPAYAEAIAAIYPLAYKLKFLSKNDVKRDYVVMPLEAQWWADDMASFTAARDKSKWHWTLMNMVPDWLGQDDLDAVSGAIPPQKRPVALDRVRLETLTEGLSAQTLHVGSFDDEAGVLSLLHNKFLPENGLMPSGKHHEIYFSDFRKVEPAKLRTLLRQPVRSIG